MRVVEAGGWVAALVLTVTTQARAQPEPAAPAPDPGSAAPAPVLRAPRPTERLTADYPEGARGDARVVVEVVVDVEGAVTDARALSEDEPFSSAALRAARTWRFVPATRDGTPVAAKTRVEIVFRAPVDLSAAPDTEPDREVARPTAAGSTAPPAALAPALADEPLEVLVEGERSDPSRTATLSRAEVRQIPGTFGDPFRAIETMPGVTPVVSGLPFFFVRGAPPGNVGYFLDGIRVPLLFHVGIGPSVVHPALIDRVDLHPAAYPARFGRFAGGIVSGEIVEPVPELHGEYNLRLFDAGALAEAPFAGGRGTALVGGRYSYTAALLTALSSDILLEYWDYQVRVSHDLGRDDRVGVLAFGSHDFLAQKSPSGPITLFGTDFHRVDARYDRRLGDRGKLRTAVTVGRDTSRAQQQDRSVVDHVFATRTELTYRAAPTALVRAGTDLQLDTYEVDLGPIDFSPAARAVVRYFPSRTDLALGARADVVLDVQPGFEVTPGVRVDLYGSDGVGAVGVDPRLATRTSVTETLALLTTFGVAHQPPAFVVPLPGFQPGGLRGGLQKAVQQSAGVELRLDEATTATTTVFQNAFFDMTDPLGVAERSINGCPPGAFPTDSLSGDYGFSPNEPILCGIPRFPPGTVGPDRSGGFGQAGDSAGGRRAAAAFEVRTMGWSRGLEIYVKRKMTRRIGGYVSYTLSRSVRSFERRSFVATFDRTHVANAAAAYDLGRLWRAGVRGTFYTGLPKAPDPSDGSTRLPPFFRLDVRLEKRWQLGEVSWISFVAEWMNATLSKEAVTTECTLEGCSAQTIGPVTIPSVGLEGGF